MCAASKSIQGHQVSVNISNSHHGVLCDNQRQRSGENAREGGGVLPGILGGGVPPGSPNPGHISDQKM